MIVLGLDFETTWTDPVNTAEARIIEIGAVLWDTDTNKPLDMMNVLINEEHHRDPKLVTLTGITQDMLSDHGVLLFQGLEQLSEMAGKAEYVVAHNGNDFDKPILDHELERVGHKPWVRTWIDTRIDIPYPDHIKTRKLVYLAAELGFANPFAHRALFDVLTMLKVMSMFDIKDIIELAKQPTVTCIARVSYADKQLAKDRGYYWDGDNKRWFKKMKKGQALVEEQQAEFNIVILED